MIEGDAFDLGRTLGPKARGPFSAIISGIPLLNFPMARRRSFMEGVCRLLAPGAPLIQFSYGMQAPVVPPPGYSVVRAAMVWANLPPARVWVYRKHDGLHAVMLQPPCSQHDCSNRFMLHFMLQHRVQHKMQHNRAAIVEYHLKSYI